MSVASLTGRRGWYQWGGSYLRLWASAHKGKLGQLIPPPGKMDEKLKSENMQKEQFSEWRVGWGWSDTSNYVCVIFREQSGQTGVENGAMLTTYYIQIYLHHFVVKFSKKNLRLPRHAGTDPPCGRSCPGRSRWGQDWIRLVGGLMLKHVTNSELKLK